MGIVGSCTLEGGQESLAATYHKGDEIGAAAIVVMARISRTIG